MNTKKRILIVDDHPVVREGIKMILGRSPAFQVVGEAGGSREGLGLALQLKPDIILLDISLPDGNGTDLIREIRTVLPQVIFLMVSVHRDTGHIAESFQAGAAGYFVKGSLPDTLVEALEVVASGGHFFEGPLSSEAVERLKHLTPEKPQDAMSRYASLTKRQREIMRMLVRGFAYRTIAEQLHISETTVSNHRARILAKLGVKGSAELIRFAAGLGVVDTDV